MGMDDNLEMFIQEDDILYRRLMIGESVDAI